ncbi:secretoglobin family 3A member 2 [Delphinapterus leucas]|uniref:Secretoglobin family 3A member 2 n=1 Tax=Delphinapterus leucas TaxID=9749 RepID=A0A2Y9PIK7_DELLE|nr:secretoglobin family 3A member 2 [Delphinapterus leucas]
MTSMLFFPGASQVVVTEIQVPVWCINMGKYHRQHTIKLVTVFLLVTISICSYSATAFLINSLPLPVKKALPLPLDNVLPVMDPLKLLLKTLGISVEHLVEGLRKCVSELGPDTSEAVKKLLEALSYLV